MSEMRSPAKRKAEVLAALERNGDGWLATAAAAGRPHLIAVSTSWDGVEAVVATTANSRTARNLEAGSRVRLALGTPDDVVMIDAVVSGSVAASSGDASVAAFSAAVGWNPAEEPGEWRLYRLRPHRIQAYRGYGELEGRDVMRESRWLV